VPLRSNRLPLTLLLAASGALAGCAKSGEIDVTGGAAGITAVRSACPVVGVPAGTGDVTVFNPANSTDASAIDVTAAISNVRSTCNDASDDIQTTVTFDVRARRTQTAGPRDVTLPYFIAITRGGNSVVSKRIGGVALHWDAGQAVATANPQATTIVSRALATVPQEIRDKLTRKRKAGDEDAAVDPLSQPDVRQAVLSATFEALVGFQLTQDQLRYNATR
jgi:hypothetical protein